LRRPILSCAARQDHAEARAGVAAGTGCATSVPAMRAAFAIKVHQHQADSPDSDLSSRSKTCRQLFADNQELYERCDGVDQANQLIGK
jgi:hypothetical protein